MIVGVREKCLTLFTTWLYIVVFTMPGISACRCSSSTKNTKSNALYVVGIPMLCPSVKYKKDGNEYTLTDTYTDDVFGASKTDREVEKRKDKMGKEWEIK